MFPRSLPWIRTYAIAASAIGLLFLTVGLVGFLAVDADTSGTTRLQAKVKAVQPPVNSTDTVHLVVQTADGRVYRAATSSDDPSDFSPGEKTAILVKNGQEPIQDDESGRYTAGLVGVASGLVALAAGIIGWHFRQRLASKPVPGAVFAQPK